MSHEDRTRFARMALGLRMIDTGQFNQVMALWEESPTRDTAELLIENEFITKEQLDELIDYFKEHKELGNQFDLSATRLFLNEKNELKDSDNESIYNDNFTLKGMLGKGGIGRVFLGYDKNVERQVAIKELDPEKHSAKSGRNVARFVREAKVTGQMEHPGIVPVYELGTKSDGSVFYVMKYVQGRTLTHAIKSCNVDSPEMSFRERLKLLGNLIAICDAISFAHSRGVVHRDLKPGNIILGEFGETIVLDWGLAKVHGDRDLKADADAGSQSADPALTRHGEILGTPSYMAPEQIRSEFGEVDARTDVYALGVLLYLILTGTKPYHGNAEEVMKQIVSDIKPKRPITYGEFMPPELSAICEKAMAKDKKDRFQDASELSRELRAYRDGRFVSVYAYSKGELFRRFVTKNRIAIIAAAVVLLSIIVGAGFSFHFAVDANKARASAENALIHVTNLSESAMELSRKTADELDLYFHRLVVSMENVSQRIVAVPDDKSVGNQLEALLSEYPAAERFFILDAKGEPVMEYPSGDESYLPILPNTVEEITGKAKTSGAFVSNIFKNKAEKPLFVIVVPTNKGKNGYLGAIIHSDQAILSGISYDPLKTDYQVWCMCEDGQIIYDEDDKQVGLSLFTDATYQKFPELKKFGEEMQKEPWGIGHYSFFNREKTQTIYKIAAWDTFEPMGQVAWKVVITYPYIVE